MEENGNEVVNEQTLSEFRNQWRQELQGEMNEVESIETRARDLFVQGVELERKGKCFEAVRLYRRAVQLVPDIEYRIYSQSDDKKRQKANDDGNNNKKDHASSSRHCQESDEIANLVELFQRDLSISSQGVCESSFGAGTISTSLHISALPVEVFLLILKFAVSNDLDLKTLERFGQVCKGFYLLSRDQEIWKLACIKTWGLANVSPSLTWRDMFLTRPRVNFNGCYICKANYQRLGENSSFQDQFYRPLQTVEYFRLIRFLPNGKLLMMTSADELQTSVNKLKSVHNAMNSRDILKGHYRYQDSSVLIVIKKQSSGNQKFKRKNFTDNDELTFLLELEINDLLKKKFFKLTWKHYTISYGLTEDDFDLRSTTKYPPFYFSAVKSFHGESNDCLRA